jgi:hypothetical protein
LDTRPYFVYMGAGHSFAGSVLDEGRRNISRGHNLGFQTQSIDGSTGTRLADDGTLERRLQLQKVHGAQFSLGGQGAPLYTRDQAPDALINEFWTYNPSLRPWYKSQTAKPESPVWSDLYLFSSSFHHTVGISATECYMCPGSRALAASPYPEAEQEVVFSVDYTLGGIASRLNSTMENIRSKFPRSEYF